MFPGFLTPILTQLFFPKPPTTFLTCFCRGERQKYDGNKVRLNHRSNSQPQGHESDTLTTEPPGRGWFCWAQWKRAWLVTWRPQVLSFPKHQILNSSKLKEFTDDNFQFNENGGMFSKRVENTVGKGEISHNEQFLLFLLRFQKTYIGDT